MAFLPDVWQRMESGETPIYVRKDRADWFVPNRAGDEILRQLMLGRGAPGDAAVQRFLMRFDDKRTAEYSGRAGYLSAEYLRELWFHLTDNCNLACSHCMFSSAPGAGRELRVERVLALSEEAAGLGARVFALTGGEPFVHPDFAGIVDSLLSHDDSHVAVLTNGTLLGRNMDNLERWPAERFHLQVSLDGMRDNHDRIRGKGAFDRLRSGLAEIGSRGIAFTLSMAVDRGNVGDMPVLVDLASELGASNVHYMWYFVRGRGDAQGFAPVDEIFSQLTAAVERADELGIGIDNIESLRTQVFAPKGTIHDGTNSGWESAAVGPDGRLYPSAGLVGIGELATDVRGSLADAWMSSAVMEKLRRSTVRDHPSPLQYILGGGDSDHSWMHTGEFSGGDPYLALQENMALWLIARHAETQAEGGPPRMRLKMGDILESCGAHGNIATIHTNCLLAFAQKNSRTVVKEFYTKAAEKPMEDIANPVSLPQELVEHIPTEYRLRSYGCGSPVADAQIQAGERVVDLGSGSGVECFAASKLAGPEGRVVGVDMLVPMLEMAERGADAVAGRLGYSNIEFNKGYLESLPLEDDFADVMMSDCVINLSVNKRRTFAEIFRVLKPGGRLVVSDVVCETDPDASIRNDETLRGECIAGAMTQKDLMAILEESGFTSVKVLKRFPYRVVKGQPFFSLTFDARKPDGDDAVRAMYRGPFRFAVTSAGNMLPAGVTCEVSRQELEGCGEEVFVLDEQGYVTNVEMENGCACYAPPSPVEAEPGNADERGPGPKHRSGCMVCGESLQYTTDVVRADCEYCGRSFVASALCEKGHFVCDACHSEDALTLIERVCLNTSEADMIALMARIRRHPSMRVHGPEHHAMVPGIILATYRNLGGDVTLETISEGIRRGTQVIGGACAFHGACGAALGVGIAFSLIMKANPLKPTERMKVQSATNIVQNEIGSLEAARCCQRDCWLALNKAAELSGGLLPISLRAGEAPACSQMAENAECMGVGCPLLSAEAGKVAL